MIFIRLCELMLAITFIVVFFMQVIIPLILSRPLFPMFRKNRKALEERLESAKEKSVEDKLKEEIRNVK